ncbi:hypothetical protein SK854_26665 [Lentzea sp. BCCO 10_0061]|uniref:PPE family domain-containing protein n=1 Tax=Lentzea sokolovensis TaxID=3095429 RepID=A0ABU4V1R9_9PSEU|nr:hypothetical protein [Lentzea sp. BCCO 10_0061]MDX8145721.1 hypothetical protein [Lentzea sp. BCCO 10_0061]
MAPVKPTIPTPNANYPGQQHEQMKTLVTQNYVPDTATTVSEAWKSLGTTFKELATDFNILINGSQSAWTGRAADGVRQALSKIGTFADQTGDGFTRVSTAIEQQREAAVQANRSMPEPVSFSPMDIMKKWTGPSVIFPPAMVGAPFEMLSKHNEQQEAKAEAVQVMQTRDNTMMSAAMSMPTMESTPQVTQDQGVTQPSSTTSSHSLSNVNANQQFSNSSNTGMPSTPPGSNNGTTNAAWAAPQVKDPLLQPGNNNQNNPGGQNRPPFTPPGVLPPGVRPPGGGTQGRPPGGGPGTGRGGPGGGGGAGGGRGMGPGGMAGVGGSGRGMGSFGPANPGGGAGVMGGGGPGGTGAAGAGAAGRAGAAGGMGAGGGAGGGKGGEDDKEHKSNYLIPTDEFFDDDRMVAPPVIGG